MFDYALKRGVRPIVIAEIVTDFKLRPRDLTALFKIYRLLRRERPLIVHTHTAKAGFLVRLAARMARVPVVVHTYHGHVLQGYYNPFKSWLLRLMERTMASLTDRIIAVSEGVKRDLVNLRVARSTSCIFSARARIRGSSWFTNRSKDFRRLRGMIPSPVMQRSRLRKACR